LTEIEEESLHSRRILSLDDRGAAPPKPTTVQEIETILLAACRVNYPSSNSWGEMGLQLCKKNPELPTRSSRRYNLRLDIVAVCDF